MVDTGKATQGVIAVFGETGTYHSPKFGSHETAIILDRDVERETEGGAFVRFTMASLILPFKVMTGDRVTVGSESWSVESVVRDDGYVLQIALGRKL